MPTTKTRKTLALLRGLVKRDRRRTDLVDFATMKSTWEWYRLEYNDFDLLNPAWCNHEAHAACQEAHRNDIDESMQTWPTWSWSSDDLLCYALNVSWSDGHWRWVVWALEHGVAPGQPFAVNIDRPVGHYDSYSGEYDEEYSGELIEVRPLPLRIAIKRWEHLLRKIAADQARAKADRRSRRAYAERNTGKMYLQQFLYGYETSWGPPKGVGYRLETKLNPPYTLAEGRSDEGNRADAMAKLVLDACAHLPYLSPEVILELEVQR